MNDLTGDMKTSYENLNKEIKKTVDENERLFKEMRTAGYDKSRSYESDLKNYKINKEITNINDSRREIWNVLDKKYNDNTKLRKFYFDELVAQNDVLQKQYKQLNKLIAEVDQLETTNSTLERKINKDKYDVNKHIYYGFMYKVLMFVQVLCIVFLLLGMTNVIPKYTVLVIVFILLTGCFGFMFYYAFIGNAGRDQFTWDKVRARDINRAGYGTDNCPKVKKPTKKSDEELRLEEEVNHIIADSKTRGSDQCKS